MDASRRITPSLSLRKISRMGNTIDLFQGGETQTSDGAIHQDHTSSQSTSLSQRDFKAHQASFPWTQKSEQGSKPSSPVTLGHLAQAVSQNDKPNTTKMPCDIASHNKILPPVSRSRGSERRQDSSAPRRTATETVEWSHHHWGRLSWSITARVYRAYVGDVESPPFKNRPEVLEWVKNLPPSTQQD
jgi:hypothetical protein